MLPAPGMSSWPKEMGREGRYKFKFNKNSKYILLFRETIDIKLKGKGNFWSVEKYHELYMLAKIEILSIVHYVEK
jgi:hypothetical protein